MPPMMPFIADVIPKGFTGAAPELTPEAIEAGCRLLDGLAPKADATPQTRPENPDEPLCVQSLTDESAACFRAVIARRKHLDALENAVGAFLHLRDQMDELDEMLLLHDRRIDAIELEALGKRETVALEALRELMEAS